MLGLQSRLGQRALEPLSRTFLAEQGGQSSIILEGARCQTRVHEPFNSLPEETLHERAA
jgi:hypothetical protein